MTYRTNEGTFEFPKNLVNRTLDMLMSPDGFSVSYTIGRDALRKGENTHQFIERHLKELSRQVNKFAEFSRQEAVFGQNKNKRVGVQIQSTFKQDGKDVFQRHAILLLDDNVRILVISALAFRKFIDQEETDWLEVLKSYEPL